MHRAPLRPGRAFLLLLVGLLALAGSPAHAQVPIVAAASDLRFALEEIAEAYRSSTGRSVKLTFGSSGTFAAQIRNGAPFQLFLSADEAFVAELQAQGFTRGEGDLYAIGRIVIFAPTGSALAVDSDLAGLAAALDAGRISRFAIANPEHAPYGQRAEEALRHAKLWDRIERKLVLGENISQAAQFATSGSAQGGIIALSLAKAPQMAHLGRYALIPESWHEPLRQRMVLLKGADGASEDFYRYLREPAARAVMRRYGFALPEERE